MSNAESQGIISDITEEVILLEVPNTHPEGELHTNAQISISGRKKGSAKACENENTKKQNKVVMKCASLYKKCH